MWRRDAERTRILSEVCRSAWGPVNCLDGERLDLLSTTQANSILRVECAAAAKMLVGIIYSDGYGACDQRFGYSVA